MRKQQHLPKLDRAVYRGTQLVHWTITLEERATGWLDKRFHSRFREFVLHAASRQPLICPIYVLMPDHMHFVWSGLSSKTDQWVAMRHFRKWVALAIRPHRLQRQPYDHVLRSWQRNDEAFDEAVRYIWENPVRAGLAERLEQWEFAGCVVPGFPLLHPRQENCRHDVDKIYTKLKEIYETLDNSDG